MHCSVLAITAVDRFFKVQSTVSNFKKKLDLFGLPKRAEDQDQTEL